MFAFTTSMGCVATAETHRDPPASTACAGGSVVARLVALQRALDRAKNREADRIRRGAFRDRGSIPQKKPRATPCSAWII